MTDSYERKITPKSQTNGGKKSMTETTERPTLAVEDQKKRIRRKRKTNVSIPYASATAGMRAQDEVKRILQNFGCDKVGIMDDAAKQEVTLYIEYRGRNIRLPVSTKGWAAMYLRKNPHSNRHRISRHEWEQRAIRQGQIAANSVMRDWVKATVTAIEAGIFSFEAAFLPYMLTASGQTVLERLAEMPNLLPAPEQPKVVQLPSAG
jgi:hypothetical protein